MAFQKLSHTSATNNEIDDEDDFSFLPDDSSIGDGAGHEDVDDEGISPAVRELMKKYVTLPSNGSSRSRRFCDSALP